MNKQRIDGALKQASGKLKSIAGKLTGDAKLTAEGLVEQVLHDQPHAGADEDRQRDLERAAIGADREFLGTDIGPRRDERDECIEDRQPH